MNQNNINEQRKNEPEEGKKIREIIAKRTGTDPQDWFLTFRAREAMQIVFEELGKKRDKKDVLLQPFTCSTVPEAVLAAGMDPVYCDIQVTDLMTDPEAIRIDERSGALIMQHTFGIFDPEAEKELAEAAKENGLLLMEDSAHCAGRMSKDEDGRPLADVSVHSFGVEKMIKTSFGAITWIDPEMQDSELRENIVNRFAELPAIGAKISKAVKTYRTNLRILNHLPMKVRRPLRDSWVEKRKFIPAVSSAELAGDILLDPSVPDSEVINRILGAFETIDENEEERRRAVAAYKEVFVHGGERFYVPKAARRGDDPLLWFPVIVPATDIAARIVSALWESGFYSSTWGRPLLFPGVTDKKRFMFEDESVCPVSVRCSRGIVLLPTNRSKEDVEKIISVVKDCLGGETAAGEGDNTGDTMHTNTQEKTFVPILLGTETSVYNMARAFNEAYGIVSKAYGRHQLPHTAYSRFVDVSCNEDFANPDDFVRILNEEADKYRGKNPVLISCGDNYTRILSSVKDKLDPEYIVVCPEYDAVNTVNSKHLFYQICEEAGVPYPKTVALKNAQLDEVPFDYPLVLKPDDADDYNAHPFEGQKKAFILNSEEELRKALSDTYEAGYKGIMLMQEFIPGGDENMRVVNGYKRSDGKVALISMGQPLLEDYYPMAIGNYNVILASGDDKVYDTVEKLLQAVPYLGYFNLDLKYDSRDKIFKVFDFNPRMGRSSYYVTLAGHNLARCVIEDVVFHKPAEPERSYNECVWSEVPVSIIKKYVTEGDSKERALKLISQGKVGGTFKKTGDNNIRRRIENLKTELRHIRNYKRYFVSK